MALGAEAAAAAAVADSIAIMDGVQNARLSSSHDPEVALNKQEWLAGKIW